MGSSAEPGDPVPASAVGFEVPHGVDVTEIFAEPVNPRNHVTFAFPAAVLALLTATALLSLALAVMWALGGGGIGASAAVFGTTLLYGTLLGSVTALPLGVLLALALRRVRRQSLHIAAYFIVFTTAAVLLLALVHPMPALEALRFSAGVGALAAAGRASISRLARLR